MAEPKEILLCIAGQLEVLPADFPYSFTVTTTDREIKLYAKTAKEQ